MIALLKDGLERLTTWRSRWPASSRDETLAVSDEKMREVIGELLGRLEDNYPFWSPDYAGQMIKPPHEIATLAYFLAQQINPNNHALDGGPATARMEREVIDDLARLFGFEKPLGHLTSSGTIANLEALWVARELAPGRAIAFSREAHYTHSRMCELLGVEAIAIETDQRGRMDLDHLRVRLREGRISTVVMTAGTTGVGAVDPIDQALELRREYPFRIHVDGAYGGFFRLLAGPEMGATGLDERDAAAFRAIAECDSVVVDPHKHGLQPYGCGSVLFSDPAVGRFYKHDSPYTYFTSNEIHLGEISLECSRPGAAAAALWATLRCFPLATTHGLGPVLAKTRAAALRWARLIDESENLELLLEPALDIVAFYPVVRDHGGKLSASAISRLTAELFDTLMNDDHHPIYLAKFHASSALFAGKVECGKIGSPMEAGGEAVTVMRSVLLKPEHFDHVPLLHRRVGEALDRLTRRSI